MRPAPIATLEHTILLLNKKSQFTRQGHAFEPLLVGENCRHRELRNRVLNRATDAIASLIATTTIRVWKFASTINNSPARATLEAHDIPDWANIATTQ